MQLPPALEIRHERLARREERAYIALVPDASGKGSAEIRRERIGDGVSALDPRAEQLVVVRIHERVAKPLFDGLYDKVWLVTAPVEQRLRRNRHTAERAVTQRLPDPSEADETINNDSTLESLYRQIDNLI